MRDRAGIDITTNVGCKNACLYCPQDKFVTAYAKRSRIFQMSLEMFKTCLSKIPPALVIYFSGMSEPWLNPACSQMVLEAQKMGRPLAVFTTLAGMNLSDIDLLEPLPYVEFRVHLPSAEGYENIKTDENYLKVLNKISKSRIKILYHLHHGQTLHPQLKLLIGKNTTYMELITRAGNVELKERPAPDRKRGRIKCLKNLERPILLPNGEVILCCMDWGIQHVLGNLSSSNYTSLFHGQEFLKIKKGLRDESLDSLCRHCEFSRRHGFLNSLARLKKRLTLHPPSPPPQLVI